MIVGGLVHFHPQIRLHPPYHMFQYVHVILAGLNNGSLRNNVFTIQPCVFNGNYRRKKPAGRLTDHSKPNVLIGHLEVDPWVRHGCLNSHCSLSNAHLRFNTLPFVLFDTPQFYAADFPYQQQRAQFVFWLRIIPMCVLRAVTSRSALNYWWL